MKKSILLSLGCMLILFATLAINANIRNNSGNINLETSLQTANAVVNFVHDSPLIFVAWGTKGLTEQDQVWYNVASIYIPVSWGLYDGQQQVSVYDYKPACLYGGDEACTTESSISLKIYDFETGQYTTKTRQTKFFGKAGCTW
jgi:hypothetical protein